MRPRTLRRWCPCLLLIGLGLACGGGSSPATAPDPPAVFSPLRLLQVDGLVPTAATVLAKRATLEQAPFDGLVFALQAGRQVFQTTGYSASDLAADQAALPRINSAKLTDNFLLMRGGADARFDRFSDTAWTAALANVSTFARLAKLGGLKGLAFDPEAYPANGEVSLFDYTSYDAATQSFDACSANLRLRGQQFMAAIQEGYPGSTVFLFGGLSLLRNGTTQFIAPALFPTVPYGLLPAFLDGMLDVITPDMTLVDGCEASYTFYRSTWYGNLADLLVNGGPGLLDAANRTTYADRVVLAMSDYLDASFDQHGDPQDLAHWLPAGDLPAFFEYQIYWGLRSTPRYLWVYAETTDWLDRTAIPAGAEAALVDAKAKVTAQVPLTSGIETAIQAAAAANGFEW